MIISRRVFREYSIFCSFLCIKMGRLNFFVLWSLHDAPRQFISKSNRRCFQVHIPLPLPKHLVIFSLGEWKCSETTISVDVLVSEDVQAQNIGNLSFQTRCLTWEGEWDSDITTVAAEKGRRGVYGKILLTVCGEVTAGFISSTPRMKQKHTFHEQHTTTDISNTLHNSTGSEKISSHLGDSICYAELQTDKTETLNSTFENKPHILPMDETPKRTVIAKRGRLMWSEDRESLNEDVDKAESPKKLTLLGMNSQENHLHMKDECRAVCPSKRWSHTMCLCDCDTAIVIGGEAADQNHSKDSLWKLEIENDFWFPMNSTITGPTPPSARGLSATYNHDSKAVFVYGGLREGQRYNDLYILNTLTWKWKLVTARGNIPSLAYHSATFYKKELFIFGGVQPSRQYGERTCSNALYIFNPEYELWYQPIVEGDRPLARFGHSGTLLSDKLIIFGGRKTATYLNDVHILDLGFMEYTAVKCESMPPLPRGFHAALPVSINRVLVSGGCCAIGALQDVHIFNIDTSMWSSITSPLLSSKPRAGHSIINLGYTDKEKHLKDEHNFQCTLLVFGGSDCSGTFYNDTVKVEILL